MNATLKPATDYRREPGTWARSTLDGEPVVWIVCPQCRTRALLDEEHRVSEEGQVTPSVVCPKDGCGWHVSAKLEGWDGRPHP